jgi:hypothetical protein
LTEQPARHQPGGKCHDDPQQDELSHIGMEQFGRGHRTRMRWREDMHHGECRRDRYAESQQAAAQAARDAEHHRQHHDQAGIEEDGKAEDQRGHAQRRHGAMFAEAGDEHVGQHGSSS